MSIVISCGLADTDDARGLSARLRPPPESASAADSRDARLAACSASFIVVKLSAICCVIRARTSLSPSSSASPAEPSPSPTSFSPRSEWRGIDSDRGGSADLPTPAEPEPFRQPIVPRVVGIETARWLSDEPLRRLLSQLCSASRMAGERPRGDERRATPVAPPASPPPPAASSSSSSSAAAVPAAAAAAAAVAAAAVPAAAAAAAAAAAVPAAAAAAAAVAAAAVPPPSSAWLERLRCSDARTPCMSARMRSASEASAIAEPSDGAASANASSTSRRPSVGVRPVDAPGEPYGEAESRRSRRRLRRLGTSSCKDIGKVSARYKFYPIALTSRAVQSEQYSSVATPVPVQAPTPAAGVCGALAWRRRRGMPSTSPGSTPLRA